MKNDIVIIGAGPVGLFTVFEAGLLGLNCTLIDNLDKPGGQCSELYPDKPIFDIPGVPYQTAQEHVDALLKQIEPFSYDLILKERVDELSDNNGTWTVATNAGKRISTKNVFIAAGAGAFEPIKPNLKSDYSRFEGKQIFYSIKNKELFKDKRVTIFGGGDSALDWTLELQKIGAQVTLIHRRDAFRGAPESEMKVREHAARDSIKLLTPYILQDIHGDKEIESLELFNSETKDTLSIGADYVLFFYGLNKKLGPINDWGISLSENKIPVNTENYQTNKKGIFAAGDICSYPGKLKLILSGFHEVALASVECFKRARPNEKYRFEFTTSSKTIQDRLGKK